MVFSQSKAFEKCVFTVFIPCIYVSRVTNTTSTFAYIYIWNRASYKHNVSKLCISDESNYSSSSTSNKRNKGSKLSYLYYALVGIRPKILLPYKHHVGVSVICTALQICIRTDTTKEYNTFSMIKL